MPKLDTQKYLTFSLKDYDKTKSKWQSYQPRTPLSWLGIMNALEYENTILDDDVSLSELAYSRLYYIEYLLQNKYNLKPRSLAKQLHTIVNALAFQYNIKAFKSLDLTDSQARSCAIRFYIENYEAINARLSELMTEALEQTPFSSLYFPENE